jgi:sorbitol-specific phosphotransferase system component IIC
MYSKKIILAISLYVFVYAAVMLDSQRRTDKLSENAVSQRKQYSILTIMLTLLIAAYTAYEIFNTQPEI